MVGESAGRVSNDLNPDSNFLTLISNQYEFPIDQEELSEQGHDTHFTLRDRASRGVPYDSTSTVSSKNRSKIASSFKHFETPVKSRRQIALKIAPDSYTRDF